MVCFQRISGWAARMGPHLFQKDVQVVYIEFDDVITRISTLGPILRARRIYYFGLLILAQGLLILAWINYGRYAYYTYTVISLGISFYFYCNITRRNY